MDRPGAPPQISGRRPAGRKQAEPNTMGRIAAQGIQGAPSRTPLTPPGRGGNPPGDPAFGAHRCLPTPREGRSRSAWAGLPPPISPLFISPSIRVGIPRESSRRPAAGAEGRSENPRTCAWPGPGSLRCMAGASGPRRRFPRAGEARFPRVQPSPARAALVGHQPTAVCWWRVRPRPGFQVIDAFSRIVPPGRGCYNRAPSPPAIDRTIDALGICAARCAAARHHLARSVATGPGRAANAPISWPGANRGRHRPRHHHLRRGQALGQGCMPLLDRRRPARHRLRYRRRFHTGLGWLRIRPGDARSDRRLAFVPLGVVSITEQFGIEPAASQDIAPPSRAWCAWSSRTLPPPSAPATAISADAVQMLGTSGTVTTLAGINPQPAAYDRALVDSLLHRFPAIDRIQHRSRPAQCRQAQLGCRRRGAPIW